MRMGELTFKMTRTEAEYMGLLICECGHPENNHFGFGSNLCARDKTCKGYKEKARVGRLVKKRRKARK